MYNQKAKPSLLLIVVFVLISYMCFPLTASANSPGPSNSISISFEERPSDEVAYVDLLIPLNPSSADYAAYNSDNGDIYSIDKSSEIVSYNENGYISYTFHYANASSNMAIEPEPSEYSSQYFSRFETGLRYRNFKPDHIKIAFLNSQGDILHVTKPVQIFDGLITAFRGSIDIDPNTLEVIDDNRYINPWSVLFLPILIIPRVAFSVSVEALIAYMFKFSPLKKIIWLNVATQIFISIFMARAKFPYWKTLIIGEAIVYTIEWFAMTNMYKTISKKKITIFVLVANTATLLLGMLLNHLGVFRY